MSSVVIPVDKKLLYFNDLSLTYQDTEGQILRIPATGLSDDISTDSIVLDCAFNRPDGIKSKVTWNSYAGYIVFTGINVVSSNATANVTIGKKKSEYVFS